MSTGLFADEEDGYNLEEEVKYKLKVAAPSTPPLDISTEPEAAGGEDVNIDLGGDAPEAAADDKPFDDTPFDAGVEADEDEDPEKYIQQLAGKLGTTLRKYSEDKGEPDFDLEKFAINSVISATHTAEMDEEDQKDIIKKIKTSGDKEQDVNVDVNVDTGNGDESEPKSDETEVDFDTEEKIDEVDELYKPDPKFASDPGFAAQAERQMFEYEDLLSDAVVAFGDDFEGAMEENHEEGGELKHNMFFNDIYSIFQSSCELLEMDDNTVDALLSDGHGWALDHIATANSQLESVYHFLEGIEAGITEGGESNNYMFFQNLKNMRHASHEILNMDVHSVDEILCDHEWALNLIARANDDVEEVYHFLMGALDGYDEEEYAEWSEPMELVSNATLNETLDSEIDKLANIVASNPNNLEKAEELIDDLNVDAINEYQSDFVKRGVNTGDREDYRAEDAYNDLLKNRAIKQIILGASAIGLSFLPLMMAAREVALSMNLKVGEGADWFTVLAPLVLVQVLAHTLFRVVDKAKTKAKDKWLSNWKKEKYGDKSKVSEYGDITISEELKYHLDNKIALGESVFRYGSEKFINLVNEVKKLHSKGLIKLNENDAFIVNDLTNEYVKISGDRLKMDFIFESEEESEKLNEANIEKIKSSCRNKIKTETERSGKPFPSAEASGKIAKCIKDTIGDNNSKLNEAEYQGKKVEIGKPKRGGSKKFYVYVRNPKTGKVKKVSFGAKSGGGNLAVKLRDPKARKAFSDRHNCEQKNDKTKPGYWACRLPRYAKLLGLSGGGKWW
jgi:hypothetical protein